MSHTIHNPQPSLAITMDRDKLSRQEDTRLYKVLKMQEAVHQILLPMLVAGCCIGGACISRQRAQLPQQEQEVELSSLANSRHV